MKVQYDTWFMVPFPIQLCYMQTKPFIKLKYSQLQWSGRRGRDRMVVEFTTTYAISAYHWCWEFESRSGRGAQHYVIKFVSDLRQVGGFLWGLRFPPWNKNWTPRYNWNIVESGVKTPSNKQTNKHQQQWAYKTVRPDPCSTSIIENMVEVKKKNNKLTPSNIDLAEAETLVLRRRGLYKMLSYISAVSRL